MGSRVVLVVRVFFALVPAFVWLPPVLAAQLGPGAVKGVLKISETQGGFTQRLDVNDQLGRAVANVGDLDGNGVVDLASAGLGDDDGGLDQGAAYVLLLRGDGRVQASQKISELAGGFAGALDPGDQFGRALAGIGDLDGDGVNDLAVGANYDDDGGANRGAIWLLLLRSDGSVKRTTKISSTQGGFTGPLRSNDEFGRAVAPLGDLDGDGVLELAVGAPTDATGGTRRGAVWILFLRADGTVKRHVKIASAMGGFTGRLKNLDWFGFSLANLGDFDRDGVADLAVGTALDDDGEVNAGAVWLLYLRPDGTVKDHRKISMRSGGFAGLLESPDQFGTALAPVGDLNGDGITELAVSAVKDGDGGLERGAVYVLFLTANGTVAFHQKISDREGNFPSRQLNNWDWLGSSIAPLGDLDGDGVFDLVLGARNDDDGGSNQGALYLTFLTGGASTMVASAPSMDTHGGFALFDGEDDSLVELPSSPLAPTVSFGHGPEPRGDLELVQGDGKPRTDLTFRLPVPDVFLGRRAQVRLLAASARTPDLALVERTGLLIEPTRFLGSATALAPPWQGEVEITVPVPARPVDSVVYQAVWRRDGRRSVTDAVQLWLTR